ncbi:hypothetical protein EDD21DRAFT_29713 [Dissophora ornata]|nr:hypothetical protein EDD21DRAFT_29713 [Dissophora ornata]
MISLSLSLFVRGSQALSTSVLHTVPAIAIVSIVFVCDLPGSLVRLRPGAAAHKNRTVVIFDVCLHNEFTLCRLGVEGGN